MCSVITQHHSSERTTAGAKQSLDSSKMREAEKTRSLTAVVSVHTYSDTCSPFAHLPLLADGLMAGRKLWNTNNV